jgi:uncharacterized protein YodC (DUF2158 family)
MEYILGFILGALAMFFYCKRWFKIGDVVYLKPTGQKCILVDKFFNYYWCRDMDGYLMNRGVEIHKNLFDKKPPTVQ